MIRTFLAGAILLVATTGCSFFRDEPVVAIAKCMKAANYLEDAELAAAAEMKARKVLAGIQGSARDAMLIGQKLRDEAEPYGSSTDLRHVLGVAQKWRDSSMCQEAKKEFAAFTEARVQALLNPSLPATDPGSCGRVREQYVAAYRDRFTRAYRPQLEAALRATLQEAGRGLKPFQAEFFQAQLQGGKAEQLAAELAGVCERGGPAADYARFMRSVAAQESPNSLALKAMVAAEPARDCGDLPSVFCKSQLWKEAVTDAYRSSRSCDQDLVTQEECAGGADAMVDRAFRRRQVDALASERDKLTRFLASPEEFDYNMRHNVERAAEICKVKLVRAGLRGEQYTQQVNAICMPAARTEYLRPKQEYLELLSTRIQALQQDPPK